MVEGEVYTRLRSFKIHNKADFEEFHEYFLKKVQQFFVPRADQEKKVRRTPLRYKTLKIFQRGLCIESFSLQSYTMQYNESNNSLLLTKNNPNSTNHVIITDLAQGFLFIKRSKKGKSKNFFIIDADSDVTFVDGTRRYTPEEEVELSHFNLRNKIAVQNFNTALKALQQ